MNHFNADQTVAVDPDYCWRPMRQCPRGVKVQLLNEGGVAIYGSFDGKDPGWTGWAPLPKRPSPGADADDAANRLVRIETRVARIQAHLGLPTRMDDAALAQPVGSNQLARIETRVVKLMQALQLDPKTGEKL